MQEAAFHPLIRYLLENEQPKPPPAYTLSHAQAHIHTAHICMNFAVKHEIFRIK